MEFYNAFNTSVKKAFDEIDQMWIGYKGLVICGSWPGEDDEKMTFALVEKIREAKESKIPVLGICFGMQVIGLEKGWILKKLPERKIGIHFTKGWWGSGFETYWHDYAVINPAMEEVSHWKEGNVIGVQFHPEYQSSKDKPHPILVEFLNSCAKYEV